MREIKFRVWCKHSEKFLDHYTYPYGHSGLWLNALTGKLTHIESNDEYGNLREFEDLFEGTIISQFIGECDINTKEIYEGDVCEANYCGSSDLHYRGIIEWNKQACGFFFCDAPLWTWENIEVIGNIWENPELLKTNE